MLRPGAGAGGLAVGLDGPGGERMRSKVVKALVQRIRSSKLWHEGATAKPRVAEAARDAAWVVHEVEAGDSELAAFARLLCGLDPRAGGTGDTLGLLRSLLQAHLQQADAQRRAPPPRAPPRGSARGSAPVARAPVPPGPEASGAFRPRSARMAARESARVLARASGQSARAVGASQAASAGALASAPPPPPPPRDALGEPYFRSYFQGACVENANFVRERGAEHSKRAAAAPSSSASRV
jgi:hypothetical protein